MYAQSNEHSSGKRKAITRRAVLGGAAGLAAVAIVPRHVLGGANQTAPSDKPALAGVGIGGVGFPQIKGCEQAGFHVAALCDIDDVYAKKSFDQWPDARRYRDFREMYQAEGDKVDAVYCGTPDHTHAIVVLPALRLKKHVCCVKPLTRTVEENRVVVAAAKRAGVATQVTSSPNTTDEACRTCESIWAGAIGPVREVHVWSNRPFWPQGMRRPERTDPVPETFDWNLWIGPAAMRPFVREWPEGSLELLQVPSGSPPRAVYHPWNFRGWWDFGTGALGDMGCHHLNTPYRALKLTHPVRVEATATRVFEETAPLASIVTYDFPAREDMPPVRIVWYDGGIKPPRPAALGDRALPPDGEMYVGDEGVMLRSHVYPAERAEKFRDVPRTLPRRGNTWVEWLEACRGGEPAGCHFDWAGLQTEFVLLGNIAIRTGKAIDFDAENARIPNEPAADALLRQPYQNGWKLEA